MTTRPEIGGKASPFLAEDTGCMRFIDDKETVMAPGKFGQLTQRRPVTIHRVETSTPIQGTPFLPCPAIPELPARLHRHRCGARRG